MSDYDRQLKEREERLSKLGLADCKFCFKLVSATGIVKEGRMKGFCLPCATQNRRSFKPDPSWS